MSLQSRQPNFFGAESVDRDSAIDPFSTQYWETAQPKTKCSTGDGRLAAASGGSSPAAGTAAPRAMPPPPAPGGVFAVLASAAAAKADGKKATMVAPELLDDFKRAVLRYTRLSKIGLIELLSTEFTKCTKSQIKCTVETVAERTGTGSDKTWKLKTGFGL